MKNTFFLLAIMASIICLSISGCGPAQVEEPTMVATSTKTPLPTYTPTPKQLPLPDFETVIQDNGFRKYNSDSYCKKNPCIAFWDEQDVVLRVYDDGKLEITIWDPGVGDSFKLNQETITFLIGALYPKEVYSIVSENFQTHELERVELSQKETEYYLVEIESILFSKEIHRHIVLIVTPK